MVSMLRAVVSALTRLRVARPALLVVAMLALALTLVATPGCGRQTDRIPRIGFVSSGPSAITDGFREGLKELGLAEGSNFIVEWRWTEGKPERSPELAAELVQLEPDLIVTTAGQPTAVVKSATDTIPFVFIAVGDLSVRDSSPAWPGRTAVSELDAAFERAAHSGANAIVVLGDPLIYVHRVQVAELAARQRLPAVCFFSENVDAGGLMSYGVGAAGAPRKAATLAQAHR